MSVLSRIRFLLRLVVDGARLGCAKVVVFTIVGFPYLLVLQKRAAAQPKTPKPENPFTYRLQ